VEEGDGPLDTDEEQPQEPKPKRMKMRYEINVAAMKIPENEGNKYAKMISSSVPVSTPASKVPSHSAQFPPVQLKEVIANIKKSGGGRMLKREGAIADINEWHKAATFPDSSTGTRPHPVR
jgi:hypothetical protein